MYTQPPQIYSSVRDTTLHVRLYSSHSLYKVPHSVPVQSPLERGEIRPYKPYIYRPKKKQVNYMKSYERDVTVAENSINLVASQQTIYLYCP